jgi:hypothetical protein
MCSLMAELITPHSSQTSAWWFWRNLPLHSIPAKWLLSVVTELITPHSSQTPAWWFWRNLPSHSIPAKRLLGDSDGTYHFTPFQPNGCLVIVTELITPHSSQTPAWWFWRNLPLHSIPAKWLLSDWRNLPLHSTLAKWLLSDCDETYHSTSFQRIGCLVIVTELTITLHSSQTAAWWLWRQSPSYSIVFLTGIELFWIRTVVVSFRNT